MVLHCYTQFYLNSAESSVKLCKFVCILKKKSLRFVDSFSFWEDIEWMSLLLNKTTLTTLNPKQRTNQINGFAVMCVDENSQIWSARNSNQDLHNGNKMDWKEKPSQMSMEREMFLWDQEKYSGPKVCKSKCFLRSEKCFCRKVDGKGTISIGPGKILRSKSL